LKFLKRSKYWTKSNFQNKGKFDLAKFKEYFKSNPEQAQMIMKIREKDADINSKYQIYSSPY
jgi:hypothetical protein